MRKSHICIVCQDSYENRENPRFRICELFNFWRKNLFTKYFLTDTDPHLIFEFRHRRSPRYLESDILKALNKKDFFIM